MFTALLTFCWLVKIVFAARQTSSASHCSVEVAVPSIAPLTGLGSWKSYHYTLLTSAYSSGVTTILQYPLSWDWLDGSPTTLLDTTFTNRPMLVDSGLGWHDGRMHTWVFHSSYAIMVVAIVFLLFFCFRFSLIFAFKFSDLFWK